MINVHHVTNAVGESIFSATMWNIVNQLGKHDLSPEAVVNNLKDRKLILIKLIEMFCTNSYKARLELFHYVESKMP